MSGLQLSERGSLAAAAERFERLVQVVKEQQLSETRSGQRVALSDTRVASPEEAWAKQFMTQAIGPVATSAVAPPLPILDGGQGAATRGFQVMSGPTQEASRIKGGLEGASSLRPGGDLRVAAGTKSSAVGARQRRRSWLGWLLLGR